MRPPRILGGSLETISAIAEMTQGSPTACSIRCLPCRQAGPCDRRKHPRSCRCLSLDVAFSGKRQRRVLRRARPVAMTATQTATSHHGGSGAMVPMGDCRQPRQTDLMMVVPGSRRPWTNQNSLMMVLLGSRRPWTNRKALMELLGSRRRAQHPPWIVALDGNHRQLQREVSMMVPSGSRRLPRRWMLVLLGGRRRRRIQSSAIPIAGLAAHQRRVAQLI